MKKNLLSKISFFARLPDAGIDAFFVHMTQSFGRDPQGDVAVLFGNPESLGLNIGAESPFGLFIGVGNRISLDCGFSCYFTNPGHDDDELMPVQIGVQRYNLILILQIIFI